MLGSYAFSLCGGPCAGSFLVRGSEMLQDLVKCADRARIPFKVLGGMTNILVSDDGFDGLVLFNRAGAVVHEEKDPAEILLTADSGVSMGTLVQYCSQHGLSGLEWAAGLPGTLGGAVYGNAGAFGSDMEHIFKGCSLLDENGKVQRCGLQDMGYSYRSSALKENTEQKVLLEITLKLQKGEKERIKSKCSENISIRREKQPTDQHSLGSVFKNPEGESAGKLIQAAGLKGFSIGKAVVSMKHANFITTEKGVTSTDYYRLVKHVQETVYEQFSILLEPEIELFGFGVK